MARRTNGTRKTAICTRFRVTRKQFVDVKQAKRGKNATEKAKAISMVGEDLISKMSGAHNNKFYGGITGSDGNIYGVPYCADKVLKIIPDAETSRRIIRRRWNFTRFQKGKTLNGTAARIARLASAFGFRRRDKILRIHCKTGKGRK